MSTALTQLLEILQAHGLMERSDERSDERIDDALAALE